MRQCDRSTADKVVSSRTAWEQVDEVKSRGGTVIFTNGCFELLHMGHLRLLEAAAKEGDFLVVAINNDKSFQAIRGRPPLVTGYRRSAVVAALRCVDLVVEQRANTPEALVMALEPDVLVKGGDWAADQIAGRRQIEDRGGRVVVVSELEGCHTSDIIRKVREMG